MEKPKYKILGTNAHLKSFCYDCILEGVPVSKANSFFRDDYEHCIMPCYAYDPVQPDNLKLQTLAADVYFPDLVFNLAMPGDYDKALELAKEIAKQPDALVDAKGQMDRYLDITSVQAAILALQGTGVSVGQLSDGYHSFDELYEFRKVYNAALFNFWAERKMYDVYKSICHHGETTPCFGGGWFIVVAILPSGQISNHYKMEDWALFQCREFGSSKYPYDGHTSKDVLERLKSIF